jgi:hypothetical protein
VAALAALFGVAAQQVADRAGVSTPVPKTISNDPAAISSQLSDMTERLSRLERALADVKALLLDLRSRS